MEWLEKCHRASEWKKLLFRDVITYERYLVEMKGLLEQ